MNTNTPHTLLRWLLCSVVLVVSFSSLAQNKKKAWWKDIVDTTAKAGNNLRCEDFVYKKNIRTVQLRDPNFQLSQPILNLESEGSLLLNFDDMEGGYKNFMYTFVHCNANWTPDDLSTSDFIEGFSDNIISDYKYSFNTYQSYTYYYAVFPNSNLRFTKSGNYILKVYEDGKPENIVLTKRFVIFQNKVTVSARVKPASMVEYRSFKQEIDFTVNHADYPINDPFGDLKIVITQNNRWDNQKNNLKPIMIRDDDLIYDYDEENVFDGGNEFRYFDIQSFRYQTEYVKAIKKDTAGFQVYLMTDQKRSSKRYSTYTDMNGNYLVKVQEGTNAENEADYCSVNFFLSADNAYSDGNIYVFGAFNNWQCTTENLMHYNAERFGYECTLYFKQGYYNYEYVSLKTNETVADQTEIEGMHYDTENDYTIYVYHRATGTNYDQLLAAKRLNSLKDR